MGKICTVAIHKGGTGKTTVSAHLAFLAAEQGSRTLLIDLDSHQPVLRNAKGGSQRKAGKAVREALMWVLNQTIPNAQEATP